MSTGIDNKGSLIITTNNKRYEGTTKVVMEKTSSNRNNKVNYNNEKTFVEKVSSALIKEYPNT